MNLWIVWFRWVYELRKACSHHTTFLWMATVLAAMSIRAELLGVTSFVRASFIQGRCYRLLLNFFHSPALKLGMLSKLWIQLVLRLFNPFLVDGHIVFLADGLKVPKEGRKMPAVKGLHQESANNSKPQYIMGHSFQAIAILVQGLGEQMFAVPVLSRICEGILWASGKKKSLLDKLAEMFLEAMQTIPLKAFLVADAYYASRKIILPLLAKGHHLITRARITSVAYYPAPKRKKKKRGRPKLYGRKVRLRNLFKAKNLFLSAPSPVYGEKNIKIQYRPVKLLWKPVGRQVLFVLVKHPSRGNIILLSTSVNLDPLTVIRLYGLRFKIEVSFKQALHTVGAYAYHFWMMPMKPIKRGEGDQDLSSRTEDYRNAVKRKLDAYHRYVQVACIAQGLLQSLAINYRDSVWKYFRSWLRTMRPDLIPSEMVVAQALRSSFPDFLLSNSCDSDLKKFILDHADHDRLPGFQMAA